MELSLYVVGSLWQDQDASVANRIGPNSTTKGLLGAIGKPSVAAFLSHLEVVWRFQVSMRQIFPSPRRTNEEDKFYS